MVMNKVKAPKECRFGRGSTQFSDQTSGLQSKQKAMERRCGKSCWCPDDRCTAGGVESMSQIFCAINYDRIVGEEKLPKLKTATEQREMTKRAPTGRDK